jgi:hypothetical protein
MTALAVTTAWAGATGGSGYSSGGSCYYSRSQEGDFGSPSEGTPGGSPEGECSGGGYA